MNIVDLEDEEAADHFCRLRTQIHLPDDLEGAIDVRV